MQTYLSYDEMLEERIAADREVEIACQRLWAGVLIAWKHVPPRRSAGGYRKELTDPANRLRQAPRAQVINAGLVSGYYAGAFNRANAVLVVLGQHHGWLV